jgi:hypothetical protein
MPNIYKILDELTHDDQKEEGNCPVIHQGLRSIEQSLGRLKGEKREHWIKCFVMAAKKQEAEMKKNERKLKNELKKQIIRHVRVNRTHTLQKAIESSCLREDDGNKYDENVIKNIPRGKGEDVDVIFFRVNCEIDIDDNDLDEEYDRRGLKPADPYLLVALKEHYPSFIDKHSVCTHWKDEGKWCRMKIYYKYFHHPAGLGMDAHIVSAYVVNKSDCFWDKDWEQWFAGLRK